MRRKIWHNNICNEAKTKTEILYNPGTIVEELKKFLDACCIIVASIAILPDDNVLSSNPDNTVHYEAEFKQPIEPSEFVRRIKRFNEEQLSKMQKK